MAQHTQNPHLLLLPPPPHTFTRSALNTLYRPSLNAVLTRLKQHGNPSTLVVALACPALKNPVSFRECSIRWQFAQSLLAGLYVIVASICAEHGIATDVAAQETGSVDVRIILVDHDNGRAYEDEFGVERRNGTAVKDLKMFAETKQKWETVFHPTCEAGYELSRTYLKLAEGTQKFLQKQIVAVDCGTAMSTSEIDTEEEDDVVKGFNSVCLGGTFDHLHLGHKLLLHATALLVATSENQTSELIVGISGDKLLVKKQYAEELQPWTSRARSVISFLSTILDLTVSPPSPTESSRQAPGDNEEITARMKGVLVRCVNIPDPFGPTITEEGIEAIVVSAETRSGGTAINDRRKEKQWKQLSVFEIDVLDAAGVEEGGDEKKEGEGFASKISSTTIRRERMEARVTQGT